MGRYPCDESRTRSLWLRTMLEGRELGGFQDVIAWRSGGGCMDGWLLRGLLAQGGDRGHEGDLGRFLSTWLPRTIDCLKPLGMMGDSGGVWFGEW